MEMLRVGRWSRIAGQDSHGSGRDSPELDESRSKQALRRSRDDGEYQPYDNGLDSASRPLYPTEYAISGDWGYAGSKFARPPGVEYRFRRYIPRALLNILGPLAVLAAYVFIVYYYLLQPGDNGIISEPPIDAKIVFYGWLILSIFLLDWAKSAIAGFEAAALMRPSLAPDNAAQLMWHGDRAWGSLSGWWKVLVVTFRYLSGKMSCNGIITRWDGPSLLWFYLAFSSILLYVAVPLAGLSMEPQPSLQLGDEPVVVYGYNRTNFDDRPSNAIAEEANSRWQLGNPTTPHGAAIFYAPDGTADVSNAYFEDTIRAAYHDNLNNPSTPSNQTISFFAGPEVAERAYGRAWGLLTDLSCTPVHPYNGLHLLNVTGIHDWTSHLGNSSTVRPQNSGFYPLFEHNSTVMGVSYSYVMASNGDILGQSSEYANASSLPNVGKVELVMWQSYNERIGNVPDENFVKLKTHPLVASSFNSKDNLTYFGYGVSCYVSSTVGEASLSALTNTFSDFEPVAAERTSTRVGQQTITQYPAVVAMHSLVYSAFTTALMFYMGLPRCSNVAVMCDGWASANSATNGVPILVPTHVAPGSGQVFMDAIQWPTISPERMNLALQKLFGEVAATLMSAGPGNWTSIPSSNSTLGLFGLKPTNAIVPSVIPYLAVLPLFALWVLITVVPQLFPSIFFQYRWASIFDGFALFRLGAEWATEVHKLNTHKLEHLGNTSLREVPGLVGDMSRSDSGTGLRTPHADGGPAFVGLSRYKARLDGEQVYTLARGTKF